jgi:hypothetical protein
MPIFWRGAYAILLKTAPGATIAATVSDNDVVEALKATAKRGDERKGTTSAPAHTLGRL